MRQTLQMTASQVCVPWKRNHRKISLFYMAAATLGSYQPKETLGFSLVLLQGLG